MSSDAFGDGDLLPERYAHDSDNVSPPLDWSGVPAHTAELALLREDADAPSGAFTHWIVTGIDPSTTGVAEGSVPAGAKEATNGFGEPGWGGPEPPAGNDAHRYVFTIFGSAVPLDVGADAGADDLRAALEGNEIARGELVGLYRRSPAATPVSRPPPVHPTPPARNRHRMPILTTTSPGDSRSRVRTTIDRGSVCGG